MNNLLTLTTSLGIAATYVSTGHVASKPGDYTTLECNQFDTEVRLPFHGPIQAAVANRVADEIEIEFVSKTTVTHPFTIDVLSETAAQMIAAEFAMFYESHLDWLEKNRGSDGSQWPGTLDFARVIRNAASHNLKLTFRNQKSRAVSWRHMRYGPADHGKRVIGTDLSVADMIVLMIDVAEEFDKLGCPIPG